MHRRPYITVLGVVVTVAPTVHSRTLHFRQCRVRIDAPDEGRCSLRAKPIRSRSGLRRHRARTIVRPLRLTVAASIRAHRWLWRATHYPGSSRSRQRDEEHEPHCNSKTVDGETPCLKLDTVIQKAPLGAWANSIGSRCSWGRSYSCVAPVGLTLTIAPTPFRLIAPR